MVKFATDVVHAGYEPDATGAIMPPIYTTTTFKQKSPGQPVGDFEYSRPNNPTRDILQQAIAKLENGKFGLAFASGSATTATILTALLEPNSHIIAISDLYGGTWRYFERVLKPQTGTTVSYLSDINEQTVAQAIQPNTKLIFVETPTNPTLKLADLAKVAQLAKKYNLLAVADNTFASPYIQRPLDYGFDVVYHSGTKYINGHSDVLVGLAVVNDPVLAEKLYFYQNAIGAVLDPISSSLVIRGIKTLALRMQRHCENALRLAEKLAQHPKIEQVYYPGLTSHPDYELAKQQMNGFGGMVSIRLKEQDEVKINQIINKLKIFVLAESLGGIESLICQPSNMTHASIPEQERLKVGITPSLLRLSVGIEDIDDLIADVLQALE